MPVSLFTRSRMGKAGGKSYKRLNNASSCLCLGIGELQDVCCFCETAVTLERLRGVV
jgi:hypothetical protein